MVHYEPPQHRWSPAEMARYLMLSPTTAHVIRPAEEFECDFPNGPRRVLALIDHLFVRYPVPRCLYRAMLLEEGLRLVFPNEPHPAGRKKRMNREAKYRRWFHTIARGEPFADIVYRDFTRKQAHWFVQSPERLTIEDAIFWAKARGTGVPADCCEFLLNRLGRYGMMHLGERLEDLLQFFARTWAEIEPEERPEILDFLRYASTIPGFAFTGRTAGSVRKLSDDWHRRLTNFGRGGFLAWEGTIESWERKEEGYLVEAIELTDTRQLAEEGTHQGHCVGGYGWQCHHGTCRIVSFRWKTIRQDDFRRITVEVSPRGRCVVQTRGARNRRATEEEMRILRSWASDRGFRLPGGS
ncbi:hypothetical protein EON82_06690 [bacterium]|nr:MAG: hypothetical protein EON82_06690 [bacterium]